MALVQQSETPHRIPANARDVFDVGRFAHSFEKGATQESVFDHVAHGAFFDLVVIEMQVERRAAHGARLWVRQ